MGHWSRTKYGRSSHQTFRTTSILLCASTTTTTIIVVVHFCVPPCTLPFQRLEERCLRRCFRTRTTLLLLWLPLWRLLAMMLFRWCGGCRRLLGLQWFETVG
jgi:hypothetical protein